MEINSDHKVKRGNIIYTINTKDKTASVVGYDRCYGGYFIPRTINYKSDEYLVTTICSDALSYMDDYSSIKFASDSEIQIFEKDCFSKSGFTTISIPSTLKEIHMRAFEFCEYLQQIEIPENSQLRSIKANSLFNSKIESISIPPNLVELEDGWCNDTRKLNEIKMIGNNPLFKSYNNTLILRKSTPEKNDFDVLAFSVRNITTLNLPNCIEIISPYAFHNCQNIEKVEIENNSKLRIIGKFAFYDSLIKSVFIPSSVTDICDWAFCGCYRLKKVEFGPNSQLKVIGEKAFASTSIEKISIPIHVKKICEEAFQNCKKLRTVEIQENSELETIEKRAFSETSIENFFIPSNLTDLSPEWATSKRQMKIEVSQNNTKYRIFENKFIIGKSSPDQENYDVIIYFIDNIEKVTIPEFIKIIGPYSFSNSITIQEVFITSQVTRIDESAFYNSMYLQKVEFQENSKLKSIGKLAFSRTYLKYIQIPDSCIEIEDNAFSQCSYLKQIEITSKSMLQILGNGTFFESSIENFVVPSNLVKISDGTFYGCDYLKEIEIPEDSKLQVIGAGSFDGTLIEKLSIPSGLVKLGEGFGRNVLNLNQINIIPNNKNFTLYDNKLVLGKSMPEKENFDVLIRCVNGIEKVVIPNFIEIIEESALKNQEIEKVVFQSDSKLRIINIDSFRGSKIRNIIIPSRVEKICSGAFSDCRFLENVEFEPNSNLQIIEQTAFRSSHLNKIAIPPNVIKIESLTFCSCGYLDYAIFGQDSQLQEIDKEAFYFSSIKCFSIPPHVKKIGSNAFGECRQLQIIEINEYADLQYIDEKPIYNSRSLRIMIPVTLVDLIDSSGL